MTVFNRLDRSKVGAHRKCSMGKQHVKFPANNLKVESKQVREEDRLDEDCAETQ